MKLISIETVNFKKLRHFKADFTDGLNVIVGDNAQGKSTLLQAIECALYGSSVVPGKKDNIPTWGQSTWKVVLEFSTGPEDYYVLTRSKSTAKLELHSYDDSEAGAQLVANGNTPVTQHIAEMLDLDAKDYNLFMQSKQGETSGVLTFGATALNRKVEEFAGISLIDQVKDLAQEKHRESRTLAEALQVDPEDMRTAEDQFVRVSKELIEVNDAHMESVTALKKLPDPNELVEPAFDPDEMQKQLDRFNKLEARGEKAFQGLNNARQRVAEARQRLEEATQPDDAAEMEKALEELTAVVRQAAKEVDTLQKELSRQETLWGQLEEAQKVMDDDPSEDELGEALSESVENLHKLEQQAEKESDEHAELSNTLKKLQSLQKDAKCPTCGTQLSEHNPEALAAEVEKVSDSVQAAKAARDGLKKQVKDMSAQVTSLERDLERVKANEKAVDDLRDSLLNAGVDLTTGETPVEKKLEKAKEVHQAHLVGKSNLESKLESVESEAKKYRRLERDLKTEQVALEEFEDNYEVVKTLTDAAREEGVPTPEHISAAREEIKKYNEEYHARTKEVANAQFKIDMTRADKAHKEKELDQAEEELGNLKEQGLKHRRELKTADMSGRLSRFLQERRAGYLQEVWDTVLAAASKQVTMASKGMISRLVYSDGDFLYEEEGVLAPVTSASGAQKAHIGVAIRIGLSRALYGSDALIIFDEPTESMSEHHASGLSASLAGAASQCLLITHREQDQDLAKNVVEVA